MNYLKNILKLLISFIVFFFTSYFIVAFLKYGIHLDLASINKSGIALLDMLISLVITIVFLILYRDIIKDSFAKTKKKYKGVFTDFILVIVIGYLVINGMQILSNYISTILFFITGVEREVASNQAAIDELLKSAPIIMIISSCILAPIEEELLFRGGIRKCIKNKKVYIACSGLIFGLMHVTDSVVFIGELLLLGVVIDYILGISKFDKKSKIKLSVISVVLILMSFGGIYYLQYGNLIMAITSLEASEVIGSVTYIIMGLTLAYLYIYNDENILENISIHAANNIVAMMLSLFLR